MYPLNREFQLGSRTVSLGRILLITGLVQMQVYKASIFLTCCPVSNDVGNWLVEGIKQPWSWQLAGQEHILVGPYSPLWYVFYQPARFGILTLYIYLLTVDTIISAFIFKNRTVWYVLPYTVSSMYFYMVDPVDLWVFWLAVLGEYHWLFSALSLGTKLPIFAPGYVWSYVLNNPYGIHEQQALNRYFQLAAWWTRGVYSRMRKVFA